MCLKLNKKYYWTKKQCSWDISNVQILSVTIMYFFVCKLWKMKCSNAVFMYAWLSHSFTWARVFSLYLHLVAGWCFSGERGRLTHSAVSAPNTNREGNTLAFVRSFYCSLISNNTINNGHTVRNRSVGTWKASSQQRKGRTAPHAHTLTHTLTQDTSLNRGHRNQYLDSLVLSRSITSSNP